MTRRPLADTALGLLLAMLVAGNLTNGSISAAAPQGPTKADFDDLRAEVQKINSREDENLTRINSVDNKLTESLGQTNTAFDKAKFSFLGVGDIVASALTLEQFRASHAAADQQQWVLCDGTAYPGSKYAELAGSPNVPDLQGRYPRGLGSGLTLLQKQEDAVADHFHNLLGSDSLAAEARWDIMLDATGDGGDNAVPRFGQSGTTIHTTGVRNRANDETRPKTTVVNFLIRIN